MCFFVARTAELELGAPFTHFQLRKVTYKIIAFWFEKFPVFSKMFKNLPPNQKNSIYDALWYAVTIGSAEYYLGAFAIYLNATPSQISILAGLPLFLGAFSQVLSVKISETIRNRRLIMTFGAILQAVAFLIIGIISLYEGFYLTDPSIKHILVLLVIFLSMIGFSGNGLSAPMWNSLTGDTIAQDIRSKFLGTRSRYVAIVTLCSIVFMGLTLEVAKRFSVVFIAFSFIFFAGSICRFLSAYYLSKYPNPEYRFNKSDFFSFVDFIKGLPKSNFTKFVFFIALMNFAVNIAGPFYSIYMLKDLKFSYLSFTIIISTTFVTQFLTLESWGNLVHKFGAKKILNISAFGLVGSPFFWLVSDSFIYLVLVQFYSGLFWAGFSLASSNFLFDAVTPPKRARCAAYQALITAFFVFVGALLGSLLYNIDTDYLPSSFNLYAPDSLASRTFLISGIFRFIVVVAMIKAFKEVREVEDAKHKDILYRILHIRPVSGMTVVPVDD